MKKNLVSIKATTLKQANDVYARRDNAKFDELLSAKTVFDDVGGVMHEQSVDCQSTIESRFTRQQLELDFGTDVVFECNGNKVSIEDAKVVTSKIDKAKILALGTACPSKYLKVTTTVNTDMILQDAVSGTLDARVAPFVSYAVQTQFKMTTKKPTKQSRTSSNTVGVK